MLLTADQFRRCRSVLTAPACDPDEALAAEVERLMAEGDAQAALAARLPAGPEKDHLLARSRELWHRAGVTLDRLYRGR